MHGSSCGEMRTKKKSPRLRQRERAGEGEEEAAEAVVVSATCPKRSALKNLYCPCWPIEGPTISTTLPLLLLDMLHNFSFIETLAGGAEGQGGGGEADLGEVVNPIEPKSSKQSQSVLSCT